MRKTDSRAPFGLGHFLVAALMALMAPLATEAQRPDGRPAGMSPESTEVRLWRADPRASPRFIRGRLLRLTADSVWVRSTLTTVTSALPRDSVEKMEIVLGRESRERNMVVGMGAGAMVGAPVGFVLGRLAGALCEGPYCRGGMGTDVVMSVLGAAAGAVVGGCIGALFPGRRIWQTVPLEPTP